MKISDFLKAPWEHKMLVHGSEMAKSFSIRFIDSEI